MVGSKPWTLSQLALTKKQVALLRAVGFPLIMLHLVDYICQISDGHQACRNLDCVDFFSGAGAIYEAYSSAGYNVNSFEILQKPHKHDLNSVVGLCQAVQYVLRLKPYAMCVGGPPCSSFVWVNVATSKRSKTRPFGNTALAYIQSSNKLTARWALLLILCLIRQVLTLTEQPNSSLMPWFPYIRYVARVCKFLKKLGCGLDWLETFLYMGAHGSLTMKPTKLFGSTPFSSKLRRKMTKKMRRRIKKTSAKVNMVKKSRKADGSISVSGGAYMKTSAAYPKGFGRALLREHLNFLKESKPAIQAIPSFEEEPQVPAMKAPCNWTHACLDEVREFLKQEVARGTYKPILPDGLN